MRPDPHDLSSAEATWDSIADSFSKTRSRPWTFVLDFLRGLPLGARMLDAGAGNGRHADSAAGLGLRPVALDISGALLRLAPTHFPRIQAALQAPPLRPRSFDVVICLAAVHHVRTRAARIGCWRGLARLARPGAPLLASVWARSDPRFSDLGPDNRVTDGEEGDATLWWTQDGLRVARYTHLYAPGELAAELQDAGWIEVKERTETVGASNPAVNLVAQARRPPQS